MLSGFTSFQIKPESYRVKKKKKKFTNAFLHLAKYSNPNLHLPLPPAYVRSPEGRRILHVVMKMLCLLLLPC